MYADNYLHIYCYMLLTDTDLVIHFVSHFLGSGLQLFVGKDGTTVVGSSRAGNKNPSGKFERVIIDDR